MPALTAMSASCLCSFGAAPSTMIVTPVNTTMATIPAGNTMDNKPIATLPPFGTCMSLANPTVAAATAAALGVLTPMPCIPSLVAPWVPGAIKVLLKGMPALAQTSMLNCMWGGVIQIVSPGQMVAQVT